MMKTSRSQTLLRALALSASFLLLSLASSLAALSISPTWHAGDRWVVKSTYYHAEKASPYWSEPLFWQFEVKGQEMLEGKNCMVIEAHGIPEVDEWGRLYLALPGMAPVLLEGHMRSHGEEKIVRTAFEGEKPLPVTPHISTIPFVLPAFPVAVPEGDAASLSSRHIVKGHSASRGCIGSSSEIDQKVEAAGSPGAEGLPDLTGAVSPAGSLYRVTLQAPREKITQYWAEDLPWFLYSEDGTSRSWLWKVETYRGKEE
jgi:hypothetical protein